MYVAIPEIRPPPPVQIKTESTPGKSSRISSLNTIA
jgi:hypothetical protein